MTPEELSKVKGFMFFRSFADAASFLDDSERLWLYDSMSNYAFSGVLPTFAGELPMDEGERRKRLAWSLVQPIIESSIMNQVNGAKGGRPKKNPE